MGYAGAGGGGGPPTGSIYVCNLPPGTDEMLLAEHFGTIGVLKKDKRTGRPKIWIYRDKTTNEPKGDATVTYEDPHAAAAAVEWFHDKDFHGKRIGVYIAETKSKEAADASGSLEATADPFGAAGGDIDGASGGQGGRGRGRGDPGGRAWQQEGDWSCPNPSCSNINFAFRGVCNRCGTARPAGSSNAGGGIGGGRGRGRKSEASDRGRGPGGPPGLFGPNDWACPMCGNINWAKRNKCNICNTSKPGLNEGGVREGRAGGYKEYDEAEIEETKRRRKEAEEDDGEMYDEFGNLKKKFRAKAKQGEASQSQWTLSGAGKAGWDEEELGVIERDKARSRERGRESDQDRGRDSDRLRTFRDGEHENHEKDRGQDRGRGREREWHEYERERQSQHDFASYYNKGKSKDRDRERERDAGRGRDRDYERESFHDGDRERDRDWFRERGHSRER